MDLFTCDVLVVGGGGAGLRAAIAVAETHPRLRVAVISKVYPMRSHTVSAEGGARGNAAAGALGLSLEPGAGRPHRRAFLWRDEDRADVVRRGQDRLPPAPHAVPDHPEVRCHRAIRRVLRHEASGGR